MADKVEQLEMLNENQTTQTGPVTCLGMTFENDEARRAYFTEELRKKLPELRKIEGFPIGEDEDILALSDPPYYTACPNPWISEFVEHLSRSSGNDTYNRSPFVSDVQEGKSDPIYTAHSYHTKVPHKAIMKYILHYTQPGDIIFDGFAGTGMTGVAANLCGDKNEVESLGYTVDSDGTIYENSEDGLVPISKLGRRIAILNDLSPTASYISYNYNSIWSEDDEILTNDILQEAEKDLSWMYFTLVNSSDQDFYCNILRNTSDQYELINDQLINHKNKFAVVNYILWSEVFLCPNCSNEIVYWDHAVNEQLELNDSFSCQYCHSKTNKKMLERSLETRFDEQTGNFIKVIKRKPVLINYKYNNKSYNKKPDSFDLELIEKISRLKINKWIPTSKIFEGDKTKEVMNIGIDHAHLFYTKRNLIVLSRLWDEARRSKLLKFSLSSIITKTASILHNIGLKNGKVNLAGALPNAIYVPSNIAERNIFLLLKGKIKDIKKANLRRIQDNNIVSCSSTGDDFLKLTPKYEFLDYIFIDPPFGANLMYSELNWLSESWLNIFTNRVSEAIENQTQDKKLEDYRALMKEAFSTAYKLLKPGRWMTVEFSNTRASVWNAIQTAIKEAGFIVASVSALNKGQGTFNSQTNPTSVTQDLVISAYKPDEDEFKKLNDALVRNNSDSVWIFVEQYLSILPVFRTIQGQVDLIVERTPRVIYDNMVAYHVQRGYSVPFSSSEFQENISRRYNIKDGMVFLDTQIHEYNKKKLTKDKVIQQSLFVSDENSAIEWLRQQLLKKPQTRQDLHPDFMKEIQHIAKHELLPELDVLLEQNFLMYDGEGEVPSQIHAYLSSDYKDLRGLDKNDPKLKEKAKNRWYVPDPNKQADLEKLREKSLLREFNQYVEELSNNKKKLKQFRTEAIRVGFHKAWTEKDYKTIVEIGNRLPESILQEDEKLLRYYDNAQTKLGL